MINSLPDLVLHIPVRILRRNVYASNFTSLIFTSWKISAKRMWELKIHVTLYLIEIYFLTKYLVENAENSISETLDLKLFWPGEHAPRSFWRLAPSALSSVNITLKFYFFFLAPHFKLRSTVSAARLFNPVTMAKIQPTAAILSDQLGKFISWTMMHALMASKGNYQLTLLLLLMSILISML